MEWDEDCLYVGVKCIEIHIRVCHQTLGPKIINLQLLNSEDIGPEQGSRTIF